MVEISPRLSMMASLVDGPARCLGDVGTDHGYLPVFCVQQGVCNRAIASDINEGPLTRAEKNIRAYGLLDRIELRLCSGLSGYQPGECDWTSICGMGGHLICDILQAALDAKGIAVGQSFVISPHTNEEQVRRFLCENGFRVLREAACEDAGHIYLGIVCVYDGVSREISKVDAVVGCSTILPPYYYDNLVRKARKRLAGLAAGSRSDDLEVALLQDVIRKVESL
ncbi:MAG: SAM-dependent methyltransferase [Clostridia bacterium]|nr:SAM-dependent methyltransferase [Clostridia bacterium]